MQIHADPDPQPCLRPPYACPLHPLYSPVFSSCNLFLFFNSNMRLIGAPSMFLIRGDIWLSWEHGLTMFLRYLL